MIHAIEVDRLHKSYGPVAVLQDLSLQVAEGEVYGLLGSHGSGKSTLIHVLLGFLKPSRGVVRVLGHQDLDTARQRLGYIPERLSYHMRYTAREYLRFLGEFSDINGPNLRTRVDEQLERVGLSNAADRTLSAFSKGMLQRLGIAQALLAEPELLLMDEPFSTLDTTDQREVIDLLAEVRAQGHTILICTHYTNTLVHLCDRIGVLSEGTLVAQTEVRRLRVPGSSVHIQIDYLSPALRLQLKRISSAITCGENSITIQPNTQQIQATALRMLLENNVTILALEPLEYPLERFYLQAIQATEPLDWMLHHGTDGESESHPSEQQSDPLLDALLMGRHKQEHDRGDQQ
jgi:ABC-2 type transport system ATP-binding protein